MALGKPVYSARITLALNGGAKLEVNLNSSVPPSKLDALTFAIHGPTGSSMLASYIDDVLWNGPETVTYTADLTAGHYRVDASGDTEDASMTGGVFIYVPGTGGANSNVVTVSANPAAKEPYSTFTASATI